MHIRAFKIDNFRSLKEVVIPKLNPITLLHGDNDVGKSNILAALEIIFKSKEFETEVVSTAGRRVQARKLGFWQGDLKNFNDNYYRNTFDPISFSVTLRFDPGELLPLAQSHEAISGALRKDNNPDDLVIRGQIVRTGIDTASQKLEEAKLNNKMAYETSDEDQPTYFSSFDTLSESERYIAFETLMNLLNDSFVLVSSRRYLTAERDMKGGECPLDPSTFKNWLHNIQMNRGQYQVFKDIETLFKRPPFEFGEIGFAREGNNLEIIVERGGLRLPIGRWGTGVQQILVLLSNVVSNRGKMVGMEEMEINLSERSQNNLLKTLDDLIKSGESNIRQVILSTHSYEYGRGHILRWFVRHDGTKTIVDPWDNTAEAKLMEIRLGRLLTQYSKEELKKILDEACTKEELRDLLG